MTDALHTKYRPNVWDEVIGQDTVVGSLSTALAKGTSHAFLLCGPSGTGKTTLARIAATQAGSAPKDIQELDAATFTGIDDMRQIMTGLQYKPFGEDSVKSIIVDECHMLSKAAWNSLLKSIEEPPAWVFWFFCTTELNKVPETIKTRCIRYELKPVSARDLAGLLQDVAKAEKLKTSEAIIELCAKEANGSPRQALVNLGTVADIRDRAEAITLLKSVADSSEAFELAQALIARAPWTKVQAILATLKEQNAESVRQVVRAYTTTVALNAPSEAKAGAAIEVLDAFGSIFPSGDGISPVVIACAKVLLA